MAIHPTAVVSPKAEIGKDVEIGPYSVIEDDVKIGDNCYIDAHVKIGQYTTLGPRCRVYFGTYIGEPQDHRFYRGIRSYVEIGADTVLREYVTVHRPPFEFLKTVIGDHVLLQAFVHVAHDCILGDRVTISNHTALSGHVQVGVGAVISGWEASRPVPYRKQRDFYCPGRNKGLFFCAWAACSKFTGVLLCFHSSCCFAQWRFLHKK